MEHGEAAAEQGLADAKHAGHQAGPGGEADGTEAAYDLTAGDEVERIAEATAEHENGAQQQILAGTDIHVDVMQEDEKHTEVADRQGGPLQGGHAPAQPEHRDEQHEGGAEVQDDPLQPHRHVFEPPEVQIAGQVVAGKAQKEHLAGIAGAPR